VQVFRIEGEDPEQAKQKLSSELGIPDVDLHFVESKKNQHSFQAITLYPLVETEISKDKMHVTLKRVKPSVGADVPKLTTDFVLNHLKRRGVTFGIKAEVITEQLFKFVSGNSDQSRLVNVVIAEGQAPVAAQVGRPQWVLDLKLFSKGKPVYGKKGDIVAKAGLAVRGLPGMNVFGEAIPFTTEDSFRLPVGKGIVVENRDAETVYLIETSGELFLDQGIRLRVETKIIDLEDGLRAAVSIGESSFSGKKFTAQDLIGMGQASGISFGLLPPKVIQQEIDSIRKWPAQITIAKGTQPVDGRAGKVEFVYRVPQGVREMDKERAKLGIVFPDEPIAVVPFPSVPKDGMTVFGESLRGRLYNEQPIYPGKNVVKKREGDKDILYATVYGQVKIDEDRIHVENLVKVSADKMTATLDLFPQKKLSFQNLQELLREADVLFGFEKESAEALLEKVHLAGKREENLVVAQGQPIKPGKNAKLRYYFNPEDLKEKGFFGKTKGRIILAAPNDLVLEKILPVEPVAGLNVYRERLDPPASMNPTDVEIKTEGDVNEKEVGVEGNEQDPPRVQYRAQVFGTIGWANRNLKLSSVVEIDAKETSFKMRLAGRSDFGTPITYDSVQKFVTEEGVRVDLEKSDIEKALKQPRPEDGSLFLIEVAKAIPAKNGADSKIEYFIEYNGEPVDPYLDGKPETEAKILDMVRPKEVLAIKTPPGNGVDGKSVFGRRIVGDRGVDLPWQVGYGISRSKDGNQIFVDAKAPGYVTIQDQRLVIYTPVTIKNDKMSATLKLFPSRNPRFQLREDKVFEMLQGKGIQSGILADEIRDAIRECISSGEAIEVEAAKGVAPEVGKPAVYRMAFDTEGAGKTSTRQDGSVDYKTSSVYHMVKNGQLLMVKQDATRGADGFNILGERLPGQVGEDHGLIAGEGVKVSGPDYFSTREGIVEVTGKTIRVIEGLYIAGDVDFSTGNIDSGPARVMIRGSVLPGFQVKSASEVIVEKLAEACKIDAAGEVIVRSGVIGKEVGHIRAGKRIETLYANSGATLECAGDIVIKNEVLDSFVRTGGKLTCEGTVSGGEIWVYDSLHSKTLGTAGSEKPTKVYLGVNHLDLQAALKRIDEEGIPQKEEEFKARLAVLEKQLAEIYEKIPDASKRSHEEARVLQDEYRMGMEEKKEIVKNQELVARQREILLNTVKRNKGVQVIVRDMIHPGVSFIYKDVVWELKEPLRSVIIQWSEASANFTSRRI